jgi:molybdenum cofactor cytidylyltransferase
MLETGIILLAAGSSSRMGQSKQLLEIDGQPLLQRTLETAEKSQASKIVVVLGANEAEHREVLKEKKIEIVVNRDWKKGMGSSIKSGLRFIADTYPSIQAVLISVCDQPLLTAEHLDKLIQAHHSTQMPVVTSHYAGTYGVPVFFERRIFSDLLQLSDGQGAKKIIQQYSTSMAVVDFPTGEIDLDTMEDYISFQKRNKPANG